MYQQATEILPFAATLWKDVKLTDIRLHSLLCFFFLSYFLVFCLAVSFSLCSFPLCFKFWVSFSSFILTVFDV